MQFIYTRQIQQEQMTVVYKKDIIILTRQTIKNKENPTSGWTIADYDNFKTNLLFDSQRIGFAKNLQNQLFLVFTTKFDSIVVKIKILKMTTTGQETSKLFRNFLSNSNPGKYQATQIAMRLKYSIQGFNENVQSISKTLEKKNQGKYLMFEAQVLEGIKKDVQMFKKEFPQGQIYKTYEQTNPYFGQYHILEKIKKFINDVRPNNYQFNLWYSGHGMNGDQFQRGDWYVMKNDKSFFTVGLQAILDLWKSSSCMKEGYKLCIYTNACYSGGWIKRLNQFRNKHITLQGVQIYCSSLNTQTSGTSEYIGSMAIWSYFNQQVSEDDMWKKYVIQHMQNQYPCSYRIN